MNPQTPPAPGTPVGTTLVTKPGLIGRVTQRRGVRQFVKFGIVGFSGLLVNLIVYTVLQHFTPPGDRARFDGVLFSAGFLGGGVSNYFLNSMWTFRSSESSVVQGVKFMTVSAIALVVGLVVKSLTSPLLGAGHRTWFLATAAGIVVNFFVNKYWTFNEGRAPAP